MAKARGNKLVPPANFSRNPMEVSQRGRRVPIPPDTFGVYGQGQPFFVQGTDQRTGQTVTSPISGGQSAAFNNPFDWEGPSEPSNGGSIAPVASRTPPRATYRGEPLGPNPLGEQVREMIDRTSPSVRVRPGLLDEPIPPALPGIPQRTTPSVNIWNGGTMQRSPSPMTYADPSTDPNRGMYDLARSIDAIRERSQVKFPSNPMSPMYGVVDPATESARRLAPMLAQDAARRQNTPMNGMTAYEADPTRYRPGDPAIQARQLDNAQRVTSGRLMDRTRSNPMADQINAQANAVASGRGWYLGGQFVGATGNPQWGTAENMRRRVEMGNAPQQATQEQRDSAQARRAGAQRQFMEENNGMNYLQARRAERQAGLKERSFRKAVTRGLNPMSPEAQALFPQQVAKMRGQSVAQANQNPMGSPIAAGAPNTAENLQARNSIRAGITQGVPATATTPAIPPSPFIQSLGVTADASPADVETGLNDMMLRSEVPSPEGLKDLRILVGTYTGTDGDSPFASTEVPDSWDALRNLPENASDEQLKSWWNSHQEKVKALRQRQMEQGRLRGIGRIGA